MLDTSGSAAYCRSGAYPVIGIKVTSSVFTVYKALAARPPSSLIALGLYAFAFWLTDCVAVK